MLLDRCAGKLGGHNLHPDKPVTQPQDNDVTQRTDKENSCNSCERPYNFKLSPEGIAQSH